MLEAILGSSTVTCLRIPATPSTDSMECVHPVRRNPSADSGARRRVGAKRRWSGLAFAPARPRPPPEVPSETRRLDSRSARRCGQGISSATGTLGAADPGANPIRSRVAFYSGRAAGGSGPCDAAPDGRRATREVDVGRPLPARAGLAAAQDPSRAASRTRATRCPPRRLAGARGRRCCD